MDLSIGRQDTDSTCSGHKEEAQWEDRILLSTAMKKEQFSPEQQIRVNYSSVIGQPVPLMRPAAKMTPSLVSGANNDATALSLL